MGANEPKRPYRTPELFNTLSKFRRTFCASQASMGGCLSAIMNDACGLGTQKHLLSMHLGGGSHISFLVGLAVILGVGGIQAWTHCYQSRTWQRRKPVVKGSRNGLTTVCTAGGTAAPDIIVESTLRDA